MKVAQVNNPIAVEALRQGGVGQLMLLEFYVVFAVGGAHRNNIDVGYG